MSGSEFTANERRYRHYRCTRRLQRGKAACDAPPVPREQIENAVLARVRVALATPEDVADLLATLRAQYQVDRLTVELAALEQTIRDAEAAIRRLVEIVDIGGEVTAEVRPRLSKRQHEFGAGPRSALWPARAGALAAHLG